VAIVASRVQSILWAFRFLWFLRGVLRTILKADR
jgi:hypothetical protein